MVQTAAISLAGWPPPVSMAPARAELCQVAHLLNVYGLVAHALRAAQLAAGVDTGGDVAGEFASFRRSNPARSECGLYKAGSMSARSAGRRRRRSVTAAELSGRDPAVPVDPPEQRPGEPLVDEEHRGPHRTRHTRCRT